MPPKKRARDGSDISPKQEPDSATPQHSSYAAFLSALNVGGHNVIKMKTLCDVFTSCGARKCATYIQSGNVVLSLDGEDRLLIETFRSKCAAALQQPPHSISNANEMVLRNHTHLVSTLSHCPFLVEGSSDALETGVEEKRLHCFLFEEWCVPMDLENKLEKYLSPNEDIRLPRAVSPGNTNSSGNQFREVWVHFRDGTAKSKLTVGVLKKVCGVTASTARNITTLRVMQRMLQSVT